MRGPIVRALFADAWYQVVDNRVFRVAALLVLVPIALAFLVGFREEELVLLFGWKRYPYETLLGSFGVDSAALREPRIDLIEGIVDEFLVGFLSRSLGVVVALAATAFFVPRLLERGAADVLFHKPVPRVALFLSRYAAGLLFVGSLTAVLAAGVFAGLWFSSDYAYPAVFWAVPIVLWVFSVVHAVSMLAGVWTRSTSAAILLTFGFWLGNGCVHAAWSGVDTSLDAAERAEIESSQPLLHTLSKSLHVLHLVLPKPGDAARIVEDLREEDAGPPGERDLAWEADLAHSIPYSLASTLAFTLAVLFVGWRRLERIDF